MKGRGYLWAFYWVYRVFRTFVPGFTEFFLVITEELSLKSKVWLFYWVFTEFLLGIYHVVVTFSLFFCVYRCCVS